MAKEIFANSLFSAAWQSDGRNPRPTNVTSANASPASLSSITLDPCLLSRILFWDCINSKIRRRPPRRGFNKSVVCCGKKQRASRSFLRQFTTVRDKWAHMPQTDTCIEGLPRQDNHRIKTKTNCTWDVMKFGVRLLVSPDCPMELSIPSKASQSSVL